MGSLINGSALRRVPINLIKLLDVQLLIRDLNGYIMIPLICGEKYSKLLVFVTLIIVITKRIRNVKIG